MGYLDTGESRVSDLLCRVASDYAGGLRAEGRCKIALSIVLHCSLSTLSVSPQVPNRDNLVRAESNH
jgi:hypothetical protein